MSGGAIYGHHVAGAALIQYQIGEGDLTALGLSLEGVDVEPEFFQREIKGDQNGGPEGPPVDILLLGQMVTVTFDLVDFSSAAIQAVISHRGGSYGVPEPVGTLLLAGNKPLRLLINSANNPFNLLNAYILSPNKFNLATIETHYQMTFKGMVGSVGGTLFNNTNE